MAGRRQRESGFSHAGGKSAGDRGAAHCGRKEPDAVPQGGSANPCTHSQCSNEIQNEQSSQHPVQKHNRVFLQIIFRAEVPWKRLANLLFTTDERGQARF